MTSYPIISQTSLLRAGRVGPWGIGPRSRPVSDLPRPGPHEVVVYKADGRYVVDDGRSRRGDNHVVNATSISVVDMRENAPVAVQAEIPSAGAAVFTVTVTFLCTVRRPDDVVEAGLKDMADPLRQYLVRHQLLFHVGEDFEFDEINTVRKNVTAEVKAYVSVRPPHFRGVEVGLGSVQVQTPQELAEFESRRRERRREGVLASEGQLQDHVLEQERLEQQQVTGVTKQRFGHDLARQAELNSRNLAEMQQQLYEQQELLRRRHDQFMAELRQDFEHMRDQRQLTNDQMLRSSRFEHAITEAQKLRTAIGTDQSEVPMLVAASAGEHTLSEAAEILGRERQRTREAAAADSLRRQTWDREDAQVRWQAEREDARLAFNFKVAELKTQIDIISAGIARGLADPLSIDKLLHMLDGAAKQLESATASVAGTAMPSPSGGQGADQQADVYDAEVIPDTDAQQPGDCDDTERDSPVPPDGSRWRDRNPGPSDSEIREEDLGP